MIHSANIHSVALGLVVKVPAEEGEEVVHLGLEQLEYKRISMMATVSCCLVRLQLTFFCSGSLTVSARLVKALRIWAAATLVEVFSKAWPSSVSFGSRAGFDILR